MCTSGAEVNRLIPIALYPVEDVFAQRKAEHFLGLGAEWWFNSSSYP